MSSRTVGGIALLAVAAFMFVGFLRSDASLASATAIAALLITVVIPAAAGVALLRGMVTVSGKHSVRVERLRQQTIEAEILRLAMQQGGRLTAVEVAATLALPFESAKAILDALAEREVADLEITDAGVIVYSFHDARHIGGKHSARGLLDG